METKQNSKRKSMFEGFSILVLVLLLGLTILTTVLTGAKLFLVVVGFSPSIIAVILSIILFEESLRGKLIIWFMPFLILALFFFVVTSQEVLSSNLDVASLIGLNIIISIIYVAAALLIVKVLFSENTKGHKQKAQAMMPETIKEFIASIEDKSKAINFVIGRVYSKFHGGSKELREKIGIDKEWYNEFSEILQNENNQEIQKLEDIKDKDKLVSLLYVVNKIQERLHQLKKPESAVFGTRHTNLKNLERDATGKQSVLDVMIKNDKDPIESYYKGAMDFCNALKTRLNSLIKH